MADSELEDLTAETTFTGDELLYVVDDPAGTPVDRQGTVDNVVKARYTDAEKTKLAGVETAATADQTGAEIKTAYESNADTNAFTDAEKTKLGTVETNAAADQSAAEVSVAATPTNYSAATADVEAHLAGVDTALSGAYPEANSYYVFEYTATTDARPSHTGPVWWVDVNGVGDPDNATADDVVFNPNDPDPFVGVAPLTQSGTTYTITASDADDVIRFTNAAQVTVTIPTDATEDLADGFEVVLFAEGAGGVTLSTTGITLLGSSPNTTVAQNEALFLKKTGTADTWLVLGGTAA